MTLDADADCSSDRSEPAGSTAREDGAATHHPRADKVRTSTRKRDEYIVTASWQEGPQTAAWDALWLRIWRDLLRANEPRDRSRRGDLIAQLGDEPRPSQGSGS